ncbi:elastase, putative [Ixodes scapularis]|uniref:Elastase, putative n=1 Tax=Ixodes scapularis TaxID=6945 RepID=B7QND4_IXOSC|nr:elastase, putative [Ixodes scapularis]|eukprot:XP_002416439.1 elastase, putative [Ixodes scapularis]
MVPDIAIIELVEKVNMTTTIQPACLPKSGEELPEGSKLYATGWGDVEGKNTTPQGDSGGPAVHKADGKWTVHGIVSTGPRPCNWSISPQGFVKVSAYIKDFIEPYMDPSNGPEERRKLCQYFS